jgi:hypothetical protein
MAVDDNWGEALRKSAVELVTGDKSEYAFRVQVSESALSGNVDGGKADSNYGGVHPIDGGGA